MKRYKMNISEKDEILRNAGFLQRERYQALRDPDLKSPLAEHLTLSGTWFYELVIRPRYEKFQMFKENANKRGLNYEQKVKAWQSIVNQEYKSGGWLTVRKASDFWAMFRAIKDKAEKEGKWTTTPEHHTSKKLVETPDGLMAKLDFGVIREQRQRMAGA